MTNENNTPRTFSFTVSDNDMVGVQELIREERARHLVSASKEVDSILDAVISAHFMLAARTSGLSPEDLAANDDPALGLDATLVEIIKELDAITEHNSTEHALCSFVNTPVIQDGLRALNLIINPLILVNTNEAVDEDVVEEDYRSLIMDAIKAIDAMQFALYQCWMQGIFKVSSRELSWLEPAKFTVSSMRQLLIDTKKCLVRRGLDEEAMNASGFTSEDCRNFNYQMTRLAVTLDTLIMMIRPIPNDVLGSMLDLPWAKTLCASLLAFVSGVDLRVKLPEITSMRDDCQQACAFVKQILGTASENVQKVADDYSISLYGVENSPGYPPIASVLFGNEPPIEEAIDGLREDAEHLKEAAEEVVVETKSFLGKIKNTICSNIPKSRAGRIVFGTSIVAAGALGGYVGYKMCKCEDKKSDTAQS